jgi:7-cyano-7-deazaguanine reductase
MPDPRLLETFPTPGEQPFVIEHLAEEFTSVCPKTGHPDFGHVLLRYQPARSPTGCVELKSLKIYYQSFRSEGIYYEAVTNRIRDDLVSLLRPAWLQIVTDWRGRGGIRSVIRADFGPVPAHYLGR